MIFDYLFYITIKNNILTHLNPITQTPRKKSRESYDSILVYLVLNYAKIFYLCAYFEMINEAKIQRKIDYEHRIVSDMIALYCRKKHGSKEICEQCRALIDYAQMRTRRCPHMAEKSFCSQCKTHCYSPQMREQIREVMRFSGPRMLFYHPVAALRHLYYTKIKNSNSNK